MSRRVAPAQPLSSSGVWQLEQQRHRRQRRSRRPGLLDAVAWALTLLFSIGAVTLCALTLVEIAERLVELGAARPQRTAD